MDSPCIRVGVEVGIAGVPETQESARGAHKDLAGSGASGCASLQICRLPSEFIKLLQPQRVKLFPECLQDLCNACEVFRWNDKIIAVLFW